MRIRALFPVLLLVAGAGLALAQGQAQPPCASPEYRQFDFWVGDWELSWPASETSGRKPGQGANRIERALGDCVIVEHFTGTPGMELRGMSVSTFNRRTGKWQQTWVDDSGGYLDFTGEFKDGQMILVREAVAQDRKFLQRMVWKNIQPDSLDWSRERSDDGGRTWKVLWPIHYRRSAPQAAEPKGHPQGQAASTSPDLRFLGYASRYDTAQRLDPRVCGK